MKAQNSTPVLYAALLLTFILSAPRSWGYTNPIEGVSTETVTNLWSLPSDLYVGSSTPDNTLIVTNGGQVYDNVGYIGYNGTSDNNTALVTGSGSV